MDEVDEVDEVDQTAAASVAILPRRCPGSRQPSPTRVHLSSPPAAALSRRLPAVFCLGWLFLAAAFTPRVQAQNASVEGTVQIPKSPQVPAVGGSRYGMAPSTQPATPPEPPVAVVYLEGSFSNKPAPAAPVRMAQYRTQFVPGVLPIQVGTSVEFPNQDDFYHNVFSYSKAKHFDLGRYRKDEKAAVCACWPSMTKRPCGRSSRICSKARGHTAVTAGSAREALERCREGIFDLVITDMAMPGMNGEQLAATLKTVAPPALPVILLTGFGAFIDLGEVANVAVVANKPITLDELRRHIDTALKQASSP